jgi:hypothetical protein
MNSYTCKVCNKAFKSYNPTPTFCSLKCKGAHQQINIDLQKVIRLYEEGHTQSEIALELGVTQKVIFSAFRRVNYKCRIPMKRNQFQENNDSWKGENASYKAFHQRLYRLKGQEKKCSVCGTTNTNKTYDWANLTGHYENINDYARMCRSCHRQYDKKRREVPDAFSPLTF